MTTSLTFATEDFADDGITAGSITLSSETASLTFGEELDGAAFAAVGDDIAIGDGEEGVDGVAAEFTVNGATVFVTVPLGFGVADVDTADAELGATVALGDFTLGLGYADEQVVATVEAAIAGANVTAAFSNIDAGDGNQWDVGADYTVGGVTLSASTDEVEAWTVGAEMVTGDLTLGAEYNADETYELTADYAAGDVAVELATDGTDFSIGATYTMDALTLGAGFAEDENYVFASYDLGGGAVAFVDYTDAAADLDEVGPSERDIAVGTTFGLSFAF